MKNRIFLFAMLLGLGAFLVPACCPCDDEEPEYCSDEGLLLGADPRDCACCGGWFIEIEGDTLRANALPEEFINSFDYSDLPLPVLLEWEHDATPCLGDEIEVECIKKLSSDGFETHRY